MSFHWNLKWFTWSTRVKPKELAALQPAPQAACPPLPALAFLWLVLFWNASFSASLTGSLLSHTILGLSFKALLEPICCYFFNISSVIVKTSTSRLSWLCCFYLCFSKRDLASQLTLKLFIISFFLNPFSRLTSMTDTDQLTISWEMLIIASLAIKNKIKANTYNVFLPAHVILSSSPTCKSPLPCVRSAGEIGQIFLSQAGVYYMFM